MDHLDVRSIIEALQQLASTAETLTDNIDTIRKRLEYTYLVSPTPLGREAPDMLYQIDNETGWVAVYNRRTKEWEQL